MENEETASCPVRPGLAATSGERWDELVRQLLIERFGTSSRNVTSSGVAPLVVIGSGLSTLAKSAVSPFGDQVHPATTPRAPRAPKRST